MKIVVIVGMFEQGSGRLIKTMNTHSHHLFRQGGISFKRKSPPQEEPSRFAAIVSFAPEQGATAHLLALATTTLDAVVVLIVPVVVRLGSIALA